MLEWTKNSSSSRYYTGRMSAFSEISSVDWVFQKKQTKGERYYEKNSENTKRNWIFGGIFFNPVSGSEQLH